MTSSQLLAQLLASFDGIINAISPGINENLLRSTDDAVYAAYVFGLVLRAAEQVAEPGSVRLRSINSWMTQSRYYSSSAPGTFVVRGAPGYIFSQNEDYGYAEFSYANQVYEIHLGVRYLGSSDVLHEFDVSIINAADADRCRQNSESPTSGKPKAIFECKFYSSNLGISLGREFVGLLADFTNVPVARLVTNSDSPSVREYLRKKNRPKFNGALLPSNLAMETEFINAVADDIRTRLR